MEEVTLLVASSSEALKNIIKAHKHKKGVDQIRCCINELKAQLKKEEDLHEKAMVQKNEEFKMLREKLLQSEKESIEKCENVKERLRKRKDDVRFEFENALSSKEKEIKKCSNELLKIQKENTELIRSTILEMQGELNKVISRYDNKLGTVDDNLKKTFEEILEIQNEYRKRVDRLSDLHREEIKIKGMEHSKALRDKDIMIDDILNKCFYLHREIQCIQNKRAEDAYNMIRMERNYNFSLECLRNMQGLEASMPSGSLIGTSVSTYVGPDGSSGAISKTIKTNETLATDDGPKIHSFIEKS